LSHYLWCRQILSCAAPGNLENFEILKTLLLPTFMRLRDGKLIILLVTCAFEGFLLPMKKQLVSASHCFLLAFSNLSQVNFPDFFLTLKFFCLWLEEKNYKTQSVRWQTGAMLQEIINYYFEITFSILFLFISCTHKYYLSTHLLKTRTVSAPPLRKKPRIH